MTAYSNVICFSTTVPLQWNRYLYKSIWLQSRKWKSASIIYKPGSCNN